MCQIPDLGFVSSIEHVWVQKLSNCDSLRTLNISLFESIMTVRALLSFSERSLTSEAESSWLIELVLLHFAWAF